MHLLKYHLLLFTIFFTLSSQGQKIFKAGLTAGISPSQYDGDTHGGYNKFGFTVGGLVKKDFGRKWQGMFEINYIQKGARKNPVPEKGDYVHYALDLDYVEVPLLVRCRYKYFVFEGGIGFGVLVREKEIANYTDLTGVRPFHRTETSFDLGASLMLGDNMELNCRLNYSLLPVRPHASGAINPRQLNFGEYNNVLCFTLKYIFGNDDPS